MNKKNKIENLCNYPDCNLKGEYRAPKGYNSLNDYQWFCLEHIKNLIKSGIIINKWGQMKLKQIYDLIRYGEGPQAHSDLERNSLISL